MKIAICSTSPGLDGTVPALFAVSPFLLVVETEGRELLHVETGGAVREMALAEAMRLWDCEGLLCGPIEKEPFMVIADEACITRYNAAGLTVREALDRLETRSFALIRSFIGGTNCEEEEHHQGACAGHKH